MRLFVVIAIISLAAFFFGRNSVTPEHQVQCNTELLKQESDSDFRVQKQADGTICYILVDKPAEITMRVELKDPAMMRFKSLTHVLAELVVDSLEYHNEEIREEMKNLVGSKTQPGS